MATTNARLSPAAAAATTTFGGHGSGGGELLSSVAAVRELLLRPTISNPSGNHLQNRLSDELSAVQQSRYEDRVRFEQERQSYIERVEELTSRLQQAKRELEQEQAIRKSLEETNEALEKHKDELTTQLEELSSSQSTRSIAGSGNQSDGTTSEATERIQALEQEKLVLTNKVSQLQNELSQVKSTSDGWKNQCLVSQRQVQEMQVQLESFQKEFQVNQDRQRDLLNSQDIQYESFRRRLEESIAARKKAEEELSTIMRGRKTMTSSTGSHPPSTQDPGTDSTGRELADKYQEAQEAKAKAEERVRKRLPFAVLHLSPVILLVS